MRSVLVLLAFILIVGCQPVTVQRNERMVPVALRVDDAAYWLEEWYWVASLPESQQREILVEREGEFEKSDTPRNRLRLALLLAEGPKSVRDQRRALQLLKGMDAEQASASGRALSALLKQVIAEQQWFGEKLGEVRADLTEAEARVEELERQLHELTTIEQSIQQRETPNSRKEQ